MFSKIIVIIYLYLMKQFLGTRLYRYRIIKLIHDYVVTLLYQKDTIEINNYKMVSESGNIFLTAVANNFEICFCKEKIQRDINVIDIGANVGYYTLHLATLVGNKGKVFAFEPDPLNFSILEKNIHLNNFKNIILVNKAVSNSSSKTILFQNSFNAGGHSIIKTENADKKIIVETITLDEYFKNFSNKIDLVKIDVEGAEYQVITGALNFFKKFKPTYLIIEFELGNSDSHHKKLFYPDILSNLGYTLIGKTDNSKGNSSYVPISMDDLKKTYKNKTVVNLIWQLI